MTDGADRDDASRRWPRSVYGVGSEPDPRFSFANERTFLAWIRTALALLAAGIALEALEVPDHRALRLVVVLALSALGVACSATAFTRWARAERALRRSRPLPAPVLVPVLAFGLAATAVAVLVVLATT